MYAYLLELISSIYKNTKAVAGTNWPALQLQKVMVYAEESITMPRPFSVVPFSIKECVAPGGLVKTLGL